LNQNPCAKALSQAAGPSLQQECANIGHVAVGDVAVNNQPGNLSCKAVIFAVCSGWANGKGKKVNNPIYSIVVGCLAQIRLLRQTIRSTQGENFSKILEMSFSAFL